jgi:hypothetical protein
MSSTTFEFPSDCRGDGYDIAVADHVDDKPLVEVNDERIVIRTKVFACGSFCGYQTQTFDLTDFPLGYTYGKVDADSGSLGHCNRRRVGIDARRADGTRARLFGSRFVFVLGTYLMDYKGWSQPHGRTLYAAAEQLAAALNAREARYVGL